MDIHELYARYCHTIDAWDGSAWAECFTREGAFTSSIGRFAGRRVKGRDVLAAFGADPARHMRSRHWNSNILLTPRDGYVEGVCYALLVDITREAPEIVASVVYQDELVREDNAWRFRSRRPSRDTQAPALQDTHRARGELTRG